MGRTIAFVNQKGGVGKTTVSLCFGQGIAKIWPNKKVLFIEMDPQGSLTYLSGVDDYTKDGFDVITKACYIEDAIVHMGTFDILPAGPKIASLENIIVGSKRETCLRRSINYIRSYYDYIIIDCPPTLSFLTVACLTASDDVIVPCLPDVFSLQGINKICDIIEAIKERGENTTLRIAGIVVNRYNGRFTFNAQSLEILNQIADTIGTKVFDTKISESVAVREVQCERGNIYDYKKAYKQADQFTKLIKEYIRDLNKLKK